MPSHDGMRPPCLGLQAWKNGLRHPSPADCRALRLQNIHTQQICSGKEHAAVTFESTAGFASPQNTTQCVILVRNCHWQPVSLCEA